MRNRVACVDMVFFSSPLIAMGFNIRGCGRSHCDVVVRVRLSLVQWMLLLMVCNRDFVDAIPTVQTRLMEAWRIIYGDSRSVVLYRQ